MSKTVEERIVEMRFDNKQFESGVKQSMTTLERLKESLKFKNATEGIQNIQKNFNKLDFSIATRGLDNFKVHLSGLEVFSKRIIENIADSVYGAVQKVSSKLTAVFNQINEGGARRAQNIEQAKFQLEGLGIAWEDIKGDIDYAVSGTAYGLDVAARAASQLVASNVQLGDDMKQALRGISGLAAMTGSSYEEISGIFTSIAGKGVMMAEDINRISIRGINAAAELAKAFGKTEEEIRDMASKRQITFKMFAEAMDNAFGEHAKDANKTYAGSLSNVNAALSRIGADIKTGHFETLRQIFVDLIPKLNEFKKAFKPVENVIIEVEAAVGKLIQKVISMVDVTKIVERIGKPVEKFGKKILEIVDVVSEALGEVDEVTKNSPFANLIKDIKAGYTTWDIYTNKFKYVSREMAMQMAGFGDAVKATGTDIAETGKDSIKMSEDMEKALQAAKDIWITGKYGNGQERIDALTAAGIDPKKTQAIIEEFIKNGYDWDAAIKKVSEDTGEAVDENSEKAEKLREKIWKIAKIFSNIKRVIKNVATSVTNVVSALVKAVTGSMEKLGIGDILVKLTGAIADISDKLVITEEKAELLTKPLSLLLTIIKGIISIAGKGIKFIFKGIVGIGSLVYELISGIEVSDAFADSITSMTDGFKKVSKSVKKFFKTIKDSEGFQRFVSTMKLIGGSILVGVMTVITKITEGLAWAIDHLGDFFGLLADIFGGIFGGVVFVGTKIGDFLGGIIDSVKNNTFIEDLKAAFEFLFDSNGEQEVGNSIFERIAGFIKGVFGWVAKMFDQHSLDEYLVVIKELLSITLLLETMSLIGRLQKLFKNGVGLIKSVDKVLKSTAKVNKSIANLNNAKAFAQIAKVILAFAGAVALIMYTIVKTSEYVSKSADNAAAFEKVADHVKDVMGKVLLSILGIIGVLKISDLAITMFTSKTKLHVPVLIQFAAFMFAIGYAIKQVLQAIVDLADMDPEVLKKGGARLAIIGGAIGGFFVILTGLLAVINKISGNSASDATKGLYAMSLVLIAMSLSIDILMAAVSWMSMMILGYGTDVVDKAVGYVKKLIITIMGMLSGMLWAAGFFGSHINNQDLAKMFATLSLLFISISVAMLGLVLAINDLTISFKLFPTETGQAVASVILGLIGILGMFTLLTFYAGKLSVNNVGKTALSTISAMMIIMSALILGMSYFATQIKTDRQLWAMVGSISALSLVIAAMSKLTESLAKENLDWKNILAVAGVFASRGVVILAIKALSTQSWKQIVATLGGVAAVVFMMQYVISSVANKDAQWKNIVALAAAFGSLSLVIAALYHVAQQPVENIAAAMLGLAVVVFAMSTVIKAASGVDKDGYKNIAALFLAFAGLATIIVPLTLLKGEDWPGYLAAMGGLAGVLLAFMAVMKVLDSSVSAGKIVAVGGSIGIMAVAMALLAAVMGQLSTIVDTKKLLEIAAVIGGLAIVFGLLGYALSKAPQAIGAILAVAGAIVLIGAAVLAAVFAIGYMMDMFPDMMKNLQEFAYNLGKIPFYVAQGFIDGLCETFPKIGKVIRKLIGEDVIEPAADTLQTHSPSKVFEALGKFTGLGFEQGLKESFSNMDLSGITDIKDKISAELPDGFNLGEGLGDNILNGLTDSFNLDNLGFDTSQFNMNMDGFGEAFQETAVKTIEGIDPTALSYAIEDLVDNPQLYETLKAAFGEIGVVAAYDAMREHEDFLASAPTFEAFKQNLKDYFEEDVANAYDEILRSGSAEDKEGLEQYLAKVYMDKAKLDNVVLEYSREFKDSMNKFMNNINFNEAIQNAGPGDDGIAAVVRGQLKLSGKDFIGPKMIVKVKAEDDDGNILPFLSDSTNKELTLDYDNSSVKTNMDAVSGDVTSAINQQTTKLSERLTAIETKVGTFDTNQMNRTNNLINKVAQLEGAISQIRIQLDTGALVGQLVGPLDDELGARATRKARG